MPHVSGFWWAVPTLQNLKTQDYFILHRHRRFERAFVAKISSPLKRNRSGVGQKNVRYEITRLGVRKPV